MTILKRKRTVNFKKKTERATLKKDKPETKDRYEKEHTEI